MKNLLKISWLLAAVLGSLICNAQNGIFLTKEDFVKNNTNYELDCNDMASKKIEFDFLMDDKITVIYADKNLKLKKSKIFGLRDCWGNTYRINNNIHYGVESTNGIVIYKLNYDPKSSLKNFTHNNAIKYFFSKNLESDILELNFDNLKIVYNDNPKFLKILSSHYEENPCLECYDSFHHVFLLNEYYQESVNSN